MFGAKEEGFSGGGPGAEGEQQPGGNTCVEMGRGFFLREATIDQLARFVFVHGGPLFEGDWDGRWLCWAEGCGLRSGLHKGMGSTVDGEGKMFV